jgi:DNA-binding HxlR family transcriptional regulator
MKKRTYAQSCAVARALDMVGERWTLLLIRELLTGPLRYKDLLERLPGIGTNLLAARLKELEQAGIIFRATLPPPAGSMVYELSEVGRELEAVVLALARWGLKYAPEAAKDDFYHAGLTMVAMKATFRAEKAEGIRETYEYHIEGEIFHVIVDEGTVETFRGPARKPDIIVETGVDTLNDIAAGQISPEEAVKSGKVNLTGELSVFKRTVELFALPDS